MILLICYGILKCHEVKINSLQGCLVPSLVDMYKYFRGTCCLYLLVFCHYRHYMKQMDQNQFTVGGSNFMNVTATFVAQDAALQSPQFLLVFRHYRYYMKQIDQNQFTDGGSNFMNGTATFVARDAALQSPQFLLVFRHYRHYMKQMDQNQFTDGGSNFMNVTATSVARDAAPQSLQLISRNVPNC